MSKLLGKRKVRDNDEQDQVGRILDWFHRLEQSCDQKREKQRECSVAGGACRTLKSVLVTNEFDITLPLSQLVRELETSGLLNTHPVTDLFCRQWTEYVRCLYGGSATAILEKQKIDPLWFEKRVAVITFGTVFSNELWKAPDVHKDTTRFDTLCENASVVKRRPDELLAASECIRGGGVIDAAGRIMDHVGHRHALAKTSVAIARLQEWDNKTLQPLLRRLSEFKLRDPNPMLLPLSTHSQFETNVQFRVQKLLEACQTPEQFDDYFKRQLPLIGKQFLDDNLADLEAKKQQHARKISVWLQSQLITCWCKQILDHWTLSAQPSAQTVRRILREDISIGSAEKKVRLFIDEEKPAAAEQKVSKGRGVLGDIQDALATAADASDLDVFLMDTLGCRVLPLLRARLEEDSRSMEPVNEQRQALGQAAMLADLGLFMQDLGQRGQLNHSVLHQPQHPTTPAIDRLENDYEAGIVASVLKMAVPTRNGYFEIHKVLLEHFRQRLCIPVQTKLAELHKQQQSLSERVLASEPWFDTTVVSSELRQEAPESDVATVANALGRAQEWFKSALLQSSNE